MSKLLGAPALRHFHPITRPGILQSQKGGSRVPERPWTFLTPHLCSGSSFHLPSTFIAFLASALQSPHCSLRQFNATCSKQSFLMAQDPLPPCSCSALYPLYPLLDGNFSFPLPCPRSSAGAWSSSYSSGSRDPEPGTQEKLPSH